jgi:hypothetical protein
MLIEKKGNVVFICCLFNDTVSSSNDIMMSENVRHWKYHLWKRPWPNLKQAYCPYI